MMLVAVGTGIVAGVLAGSRVSDRLLRQGTLNARVLVPMAALLASVLLLVSGYAKSYKESQLYFFPVFLVVFLAADAKRYEELDDAVCV